VRVGWGEGGHFETGVATRGCETTGVCVGGGRGGGGARDGQGIREVGIVVDVQGVLRCATGDMLIMVNALQGVVLL
jgi:hypothetical protein